MHYTSIENIHKVIDPLFLDDLKNELEEIRQIPVQRTKEKKLKEFQKNWQGCGGWIRHQEVEISLQKRISVSGDWKM